MPAHRRLAELIDIGGVRGEQRLAVADWVLDNSGPVSDLDQKVDDLWAALGRPAVGD